MEEGRIIEFDRYVSILLSHKMLSETTLSPAVLLKDPSSKFYSLCKATGRPEFATLKTLADMAGNEAGLS